MMFEERSTKQSGGKGGKLPEPVRYSPPRLPPPPAPQPKKEEVPNGYNGRKTPRDDDDDRNDRNERDDRRESKRSREPSKERISRAPSRNEEEPKRRSRTPSKERPPSSVTRAEDIADSDFDPRRPRYMDDPNRAAQPPPYNNNKDRSYPRDPKDYLIGGIYGPQPKTKPAEPNNGRSTATRRSRSYPRASSKDDDDDDYDDNDSFEKQNGAGRGKQELRRDAAAGRYGNNGGTRAFSLIDLKTGDDGKSPTGAAAAKHGARARGRGALSDPERPSDRSRSDDEAVAGKKNLNQQRRKQPPRRVDNRPAWVNQPVQQEHPETFHVNSKARLVTFFKNGDIFFPGVKVSLRIGKDFGSLEALYTYLTQRTDLANGVRYVFGFDGRRIRRLDELEDGASYVCSSRKKFQRMPYGSSRNDWKPHSKFENQADLKLFRDPLGSTVSNLGSPGPKTVAGVVMAPGGGGGGGGGKAERKSPETQAQQGSKEGRVIRVINAQDPSIQSRIILNLRTSQPWENVLEDLGEALRMPGAKKLFTTSGHEVQSFSQLRNDYRDVDTFYLSNANSKPRPTDDDFYLYNNVAKPARGGANNSEQPRRGRAPRPNAPGRPGSAPPSARARELEMSERTNATRGRDRDRGRSRNGNNAKNNHPKSISPMREADGLLDPVRVKVNGQRRELYAPLQHKMIRDESPPDKTMQLNWVYPWQREMQQMNERPDFRF